MGSTYTGGEVQEGPVTGMNVVLMIRDVGITSGFDLDKLLGYQLWSLSFFSCKK